MTTPRIEEMVEELLKEAINDFDMAKASAGREVSFSYWFRDEMTKALTEAHQAGYTEGYKQGKFDAEMDANYIPPLPEGKTLDDVIMEQWNPDKTCTCNGSQTTTDNKCVFCGYIKALTDNK